MRLISKTADVEIWAVPESWGTDYLVYGITSSGDPRVCPSIGMAHEVAAEAIELAARRSNQIAFLRRT